MTEDELVATYPRLWHMAHAGAWPAIRHDGLMSATALLDAYDVTPDQREALRSARRPNTVPLAKAGKLGAVLRDQKPMTDSALEKCLQDGLSPKDWYELLNGHSFFWLSRERIWRLLGARAYRNVGQTVLTVNTKSLVAAHRANVRLSPLNSGSTLYSPISRGKDTFRRVADFPFDERAKTRPTATNVVELLVVDGVPDIAKHVLAVHECRNDKILSVVWSSPVAGQDDHP